VVFEIAAIVALGAEQTTAVRLMSKKPSVQNDYDAKRDRLEITVKHYSLKKKSARRDLIKHLLEWLEGSPGLAKATEKKAKKDELPKTPWKETKLPIGGD
jgi:hypothetical protein